MKPFAEIVRDNLTGVRQRIEEAALRAGRTAREVRLIAVTKYLNAEQTAELPKLGLEDLGESRPQALWDKAAHLASTSAIPTSEIPTSAIPTSEIPVRWHLVGQLQRNKVRKTLPLVEMVHSVHNVRLIDALERVAGELELTARVLLEVNVSEESAKSGFLIEQLPAAFERLADCQRVTVEGLMAMGGLHSDAEQLRREFACLRETRAAWQEETGWALPELSMGMSQDFELAIAEGATTVRLGSVLYQGAYDEGSL